MKTYQVSLLLLLAGCVEVPTQQQVTTEYYGDPIEQADAEGKAKVLMHGLLKDPESAHYECVLSGKGWLGSGKAWGGIVEYGWLLSCSINARNSYGAYAGVEKYAFLYRNGILRRAVHATGGGVAVVYSVD